MLNVVAYCFIILVVIVFSLLSQHVNNNLTACGSKTQVHI